MTLVSQVARYIGWSERDLETYSRVAPRTYRKYSVPKRGGKGVRRIAHPAKTTKAIQYALMAILLDRLPVHDSAIAYRLGRKSPLRQSCLVHAKYRYTIKLDFTDFFPSIRPVDLRTAILASPLHCHFASVEDDARLCEDALFMVVQPGVRGLAIGAPSSPVISNVVMYQLDGLLHAASAERRGFYSRYADDMAFSCNKKGLCSEFERVVRQLIRNIEAPGHLVINESKTRYMSRAGRRTLTGLFMTPDQTLSIGRKKKRYIKSLLNAARFGALDEEKQEYLAGYLSFVRDVEPQFYNRLVIKYGGKVVGEANQPQLKEGREHG